MSVFESKTMNINFKKAVSYLTFKNLESYNFFKHAYSTRLGGISSDEFKSLNLGFKTKDSFENVNKNFDIFCDAFGTERKNLAITSQIHGDKIKCIHKNEVDSFTEFDGYDGLITDEAGISLATFHADCLAVYMIDVKKKVVGLAHAGWRGTVKSIAVKLAEKFISTYNSSINDIVCALGPSIGKCCFEVSSDTIEEFKKLAIPETYIFEGNKISLSEVNKQLLIKFGMKKENIFTSDVCTMCNHDLLFSHRKTGGKRGTNAAFISIL